MVKDEVAKGNLRYTASSSASTEPKSLKEKVLEGDLIASSNLKEILHSDFEICKSIWDTGRVQEIHVS